MFRRWEFGKDCSYFSIMKRKPNTTAEWIAIILVGVISLLHIGLRISGGFELSFINTLIGIAFVICFFKNLSVYKSLLFIWAFLQALELNFPVGNHIVNFDQVFSTGFGLTFNLRSGSYFYLGVGFAGIFYTALAVKVKMDSLYGSIVRLKPFKKDSFLNDFLPADVTIVKRLTIGDDNSWFLVELENENPKYGLIKGKEDYMIKKGKNQIVQFMKVDDPQWVLRADTLDKNLIKTGAWAVVE